MPDFEKLPTGTMETADLALGAEGARVRARVHQARGASAGIVWVFGAGGGLGGPAGGLYERLATRLQPSRIASVQVDYRKPAVLDPCVSDTLAGAEYLESQGVTRIVLVGHSFGGAVVINAGVRNRSVVGVAALSSQSYQTAAVADLSPGSPLLIHGEDDEVLPAACSLDLYRRAKEPKRLVLYPGCRHGLDQCRDEIDRDLTAWLEATLTAGTAS